MDLAASAGPRPACVDLGPVLSQKDRRKAFSPPRRVRLAASSRLLLLSALLAGCGTPAVTRFDLLGAVDETARVATDAARPQAIGGFSFAEPPQLVTIEVGGETRRVVRTGPEGFLWRGSLPEGARLHVGGHLSAEAMAKVASFEAVVELVEEEYSEVVAVARWRRGDAPRWFDVGTGLERYAGRHVELRFRASVQPLPGMELPEGAVAWGPVTLEGSEAVAAPEARPGRRPNVLVILIDTLRADHVSAYGYHRSTTPEIDRWLGRGGTRFDHAYAQAAWTLPSVAALFTGRFPGEFVHGAMASYALPAASPTLAERLRERGYETGAFVANPTVHAGIGFARGFDTYYNPPLSVESMKLSADDLTPRIESWLAAHQRRPFFLYAHYIDPHDPYLAPDLKGGRSSFLPDYDGPVTGDWIHGIYNGRLTLPRPEQDIEQIKALYDAEIRYVDRHVGRLLSALEPEVLRDTVVVLTSDHGEELFDHGGWKHGQTLYEEQIRVPLFVRWDGRVPADRSIDTPVMLVDVLPTLLDATDHGSSFDTAAGKMLDLDGTSLLPGLTGVASVPRRVVWSRHLASGPWRAAAIDGRDKLMLFNAREAESSASPLDGLQEHLLRIDLERLPVAAWFDLASDPRELVNRVEESDTAGLATLRRAMWIRLDQETPGLRVVVAGDPAARGCDVTIRFAQQPLGMTPWLLSSADSASMVNDTLRLTLQPGRTSLARGALVAWTQEDSTSTGSGAFIRSVEADCALPLFLPSGRRTNGGPISRSELTAQGPLDPVEAGLYLWLPQTGTVEVRAEDAETRERLRALGYLQ